MSSGKLEQGYPKNYEVSYNFDEFTILNEINSQFSDFTAPWLYKRYKNSHYTDNVSHTNEVTIDIHLKMVEKIHKILLNSQNLTQKQKFEYCNSQRLYMKLYLKKIYDKIYD